MMRVKIVGTPRIVLAIHLRPPLGRNFPETGSIPRTALPILLVMTTLPLTERPAMRAEPAAGNGEFRPSAAFPLPRLRPVADFVALPSTKRYITIQGKFSLALLGSGLWLVLATIGSIAVAPSVAAAVTWPIAVALLLGVVAVPGFFLTFFTGAADEIFSFGDPGPALAYALGSIADLFDPQTRRYRLRPKSGATAAGPPSSGHGTAADR